MHARFLLFAVGCWAVPVLACATEPTYKEVKMILSMRCQACHAETPEQMGIYDAPDGVKFDTPEQIRLFARDIVKSAVTTMTMPPHNVTDMTDAERQTLASWYAAGGKAP